MLTAVAIVSTDTVKVVFQRATASTATTVEGEHTAVTTAEGATVAEGEHATVNEDGVESPEVTGKDLNPIFPEVKEVLWGFGSFVVLALLMRYFLYPRLRVGMDARYRQVHGDREAAERLTVDARTAVADYESQVAAVRAEGQQRIEAARATLESERSARLAEVNGRINERRAAAQAEADAAWSAAQQDVESAVRTVASRAGELALGQAPDESVVNRAVAETMSAGASR